MQDSDNKGFALYDDVAGVVTDDLPSGGDIHELFEDFENAPVELLSDAKEFTAKEEVEDLSDLDLTPGALDKSNDSVRVYLREMGMVPLLTREGEIELAKRIERGETAVRKALSRSHLILHLKRSSAWSKALCRFSMWSNSLKLTSDRTRKKQPIR
jgi:RNA polymerase primary sigma factor